MVEDIEELGSESEAESLAQMKSLVDREIKVDQVRTPQHGAFRVPEIVSETLSNTVYYGKRRNSERLLVEPAVPSLMAGIGAALRCLPGHIEGKVVRVVNPVRTRAGNAGVGDVATEEGVKGLAAA